MAARVGLLVLRVGGGQGGKWGEWSGGHPHHRRSWDLDKPQGPSQPWGPDQHKSQDQTRDNDPLPTTTWMLGPTHHPRSRMPFVSLVPTPLRQLRSRRIPPPPITLSPCRACIPSPYTHLSRLPHSAPAHPPRTETIPPHFRSGLALDGRVAWICAWICAWILLFHNTVFNMVSCMDSERFPVLSAPSLGPPSWPSQVVE